MRRDHGMAEQSKATGGRGGAGVARPDTPVFAGGAAAPPATPSLPTEPAVWPGGTTRTAVVAAAVSGVWTMTLLAFAVEPGPTRTAGLDTLGLPLSLLAATGAAVGLAGGAVILNDLIDRRRDLALRRDAPAPPAPPDDAQPPTPRPALGGRAAGVLVVAMLGLGVGCAAVLGFASAAVAALLAAAIVFYNLVGRFLPAVGIVTLGLLHALGMGVPNPAAAFAWPVLLTLTHVLAAGVARHRLEDRRPRLRGVDLAGVLLGWGFWSLGLLTLIRHRGGWTLGPDLRWAWVGPTLAVVVFVLLAAWLTRHRRVSASARRRAAARFRRLSMLWLVVYDAAWLLSAALIWQTAAVFAAAGAVGLIGWVLAQRHA